MWMACTYLAKSNASRRLVDIRCDHPFGLILIADSASRQTVL